MRGDFGLRKYEIGDRIRKYRESRSLTQKQLAQMLNVTSSRVSNWEQGINRPDADMLSDLCRALRVSPSDLLDVRLTEDEFTEHERNIVYAYRDNPKVRHAVDILLGIDNDDE